MRRRRMHGMPPICFGSTVTRVNFMACRLTVYEWAYRGTVSSMASNSRHSSLVIRGPSFRHLELEPACLADPLGSVQNFQGDQAALLVVIENYPRLALVAFDDV